MPSPILTDPRTWQEADAITRRCLIGTGIVSGLDLALDAQHHICVTPGKAITSDGRYVELTRTLVFAFYRDYDAATGYPLFFDDGEQLPIWQLVEAEDFRENDQSLMPQYGLERLNPFLRDKIVLLYLAPLSIPDPDESGEVPEDEPATHEMQFLLLQREDLLRKLDISRLATQLVWETLEDDDDYIYSDAYNPDDDRPRTRDINKALNPATRLPEIPLRRFAFGKGDPFDCPPTGPDTSEFPEIKSLTGLYRAYLPLIDEAIEALDAGLTRLYRYFSPLLGKHPAWDFQETVDILCAKWEAFQRRSEEEDDPHMEYVQYFYDWLRDLLKGYHELRRELIDFTFISLPDTNEFTRHLLLGQPLREEAANVPKPFRQHFKQPPVYNGQADRLQSIRLHYWRLLVMIKNFYLPDYISEDKIGECNTPLPEDEEPLDYSQIKITPGRYYDWPLGEQSMPYYYYPIANHRYSLHHFWNYARTKAAANDQLLSYHANDSDDSYTHHLHVIRPLHYNIDEYGFLRIEGHIGQWVADYTETDAQGNTVNQAGVRNRLEHLRDKYNLDIDLLFVELDEAHPLTAGYQFQITGNSEAEEHYFSFRAKLLGMEHLAGVKRGGTFIVIVAPTLDDNGNATGNGRVIADFSLPFRCCGTEEAPPPPPQETTITGRVIHCADNRPVAEVEIQWADQSTLTDGDGRFTRTITAVEELTLTFRKADLMPVTRPFNLQAGATNDLGDITLRPRLVTVNGVVTFENQAIPGATIEVNTPGGELVGRTSSGADGRYSLPNVPRGDNVFIVNWPQVPTAGIRESREVIAECDLVRHDFNLRREGGAGRLTNNFANAGILRDAYFEALDVEPQSRRAANIRSFFVERVDRYATSFMAAREQPAVLGVTALDETQSAIDRMINDPGLTTTQLHSVFRSAAKALAEARLEGTRERQAHLVAAGESLNKLYLYRAALNQPDNVTDGTLNSLKFLIDLSSQAEVQRLQTEWAGEVGDNVHPAVVEKIKNFRP